MPYEYYIEKLNSLYRYQLIDAIGYPGKLTPVTPKRAFEILSSNETWPGTRKKPGEPIRVYGGSKDKRFGYQRFFIAPEEEKSRQFQFIKRLNKQYGKRIVPIQDMPDGMERRKLTNAEASNLLSTRRGTVFGERGATPEGMMFVEFYIAVLPPDAKPLSTIGKRVPSEPPYTTEDRFTDRINKEFGHKVLERDILEPFQGEDPFSAKLRYISSEVSPQEAYRRIRAGQQIYGIQSTDGSGRWTKFYTSAAHKARMVKPMKAKKRNLTMLERAMRMVRR